jgi:acyl-CoA dehydrogenase
MSTPAAAHRGADTAELATMVLDAANRLFAGEVTRERMAQADRGEWQGEIWSAVEQAGLPLALVPEAAGGAGLPIAQGLQLARRAGYHTVPVPLAETMLAALAWTQAGGGALSIPSTIAPARVEDELHLVRAHGNWRLSGSVTRVPWVPHVRQLVLFARDAAGQPFLVLLDADAGTQGTQRNLANEPRQTLQWEGLEIPDERVRPAPVMFIDGLLCMGALLRAQQMVGAMERCLDYAIAYAMERQQFGRPIAKFQAIQHMLADAAGQFAAASAAADLAADAVGQSDFEFAVAVAKARVGEAAGKVAETCHQVHGAMGFTQEHPLHFATRRLWSWRDEFGHEAFWQQRIGALVCAAGGDALWERLVG